jgi:Ca-activated chloride channel family protein
VSLEDLELHHPWLLLAIIPALAAVAWRHGLLQRLFRRRGYTGGAAGGAPPGAPPAIIFPTVARLKGLRPTLRQRLRILVPALQALAAAALVVAAARPRQGDARTVVRSEGIAIQMVLDRSSSMEEKMKYSGRERTMMEIVKDVFTRFVQGGDGLKGRTTDLVGLTTFARFTEESCPLVSSHEPLVTTVKNLTSVEPFLDRYRQATRDPRRAAAYNPLNATAIGDGLKRAALSLITAEDDLSGSEDSGGYKIKGKVIILLTDGENNAGEDPVEAGKYAAANGVRVYYVVFREPVETQETFFGQRVVVRRIPEDEILEGPREVVKESGGKAYLATNGDELRDIYDEIDRLEKSEIGKIEFRSYQERYRMFLIPGLVCAILAFFLGETMFRSIP